MTNISLIITCYNSSKTIEVVIKQILNFIKNNDEIVIVDDGSTDDTVKIIDNIADNVTNELEIISLNLCAYFCPKKPDKNEPIKGKKTIAKSKIYPLIELISSTLIEPLFL